MAKVDLSKYGITGTTEVVYNPSYEQLFEEETSTIPLTSSCSTRRPSPNWKATRRARSASWALSTS